MRIESSEQFVRVKENNLWEGIESNNSARGCRVENGDRDSKKAYKKFV